MSENAEKFIQEYSGEISKLDPEILQNPAFKRIIEHQIVRLAYPGEGVAYSWSTKDHDGNPKITQMQTWELGVYVFPDGKGLQVSRIATPLNISGVQYQEEQAEIMDIELSEEGDLTFTDSHGYLLPTNDKKEKNLRTNYSYQQFDKKGNQIVISDFCTTTYVDRGVGEKIGGYIGDHKPKFTKWDIEEQKYSFYGELEFARHVRRDMINPVVNYIKTKGPSHLSIGSRNLNYDDIFQLADYNGEHIEYFPFETANIMLNSESFSREFIWSQKSTDQEARMFHEKVKWLYQKAVSEGLIKTESSELEENNGKNR